MARRYTPRNDRFSRPIIGHTPQKFPPGRAQSPASSHRHARRRCYPSDAHPHILTHASANVKHFFGFFLNLFTLFSALAPLGAVFPQKTSIKRIPAGNTRRGLEGFGADDANTMLILRYCHSCPASDAPSFFSGFVTFFDLGGLPSRQAAFITRYATPFKINA